MKKLLIILFVLCLCISASAQFNDSEKMFGQQLNLGHWSTDGIIGYWRFIEAGNLVGESLLSNDGTIIGPTWQGDGLFFDGASSVNMGVVSALDTSDELTIIAVCTPGGVSADGVLVNNLTAGGAEGISLFQDDVASVSGRTDTFSIFIAKAAPFGENARIEGTTGLAVIGKRIHIAVTIRLSDLTGLRLYINGVEDMNSPVSMVGIDDLNTGGEPLTFGSGILNSFLGNISDVKIYTRVLSAQEIQALYVDSELPILDEPIWLFFSPDGVIDIGAIMQALREDKTGGKQSKAGGKQ